MVEETVTVGDTEVTLEETDDGVEIVEQRGTFEVYLTDKYPLYDVIPQGENTKFSDCEFALQAAHCTDYLSKSTAQRLIADLNVCITWIGVKDGKQQVGVVPPEHDLA